MCLLCMQCAGQSNMEFEIGVNDNVTAILAASPDSHLRLFSTKRAKAPVPLTDLTSGTPYVWAAANATTIGGGSSGSEPLDATPGALGFPGPGYYSAVCYLYGRALRRAHPDVPVGLVTSQWGGTKVGKPTPVWAPRLCFETELVITTLLCIQVELWSPPDALAQCNTTTGGEIWNGMVHPLRRMALSAFVWYQVGCRVGGARHAMLMLLMLPHAVFWCQSCLQALLVSTCTGQRKNNAVLPRLQGESNCGNPRGYQCAVSAAASVRGEYCYQCAR